MRGKRVGVKIYSLDWYLAYGLDYDEAAATLAEHGFTFVIAQNRYLPMTNSAVESEISPEQASRFEQYSDVKFVNALRAHGIEYWAAANIFFDTETLTRHPDAVPVDAAGNRAEMIDWYLGSCPTHGPYIEEKLNQLAHASAELNPDGVFLGFTRFPGFWETWMPEDRREQKPEFCYCDRCLSAFARASGLSMPPGPIADRAQWIERASYQDFVGWKGDVIRDVIARIGEVVRRHQPTARIMLNTLPFRPEDFERAGVEVFAQDWRKLAEVVDVFELMTYHQILGRDPDWILSVIEAFKATVDRPAVCTIQTDPLYTHGMHAGRGRASELPADEFRSALETAWTSSADGIVVFTWSQLLHDLAAGDSRRIDAVRRLGARRSTTDTANG